MKKIVFLVVIALTFFSFGYTNVYAEGEESTEITECNYTKYKIIYNTNGGNNISSKSVAIGTTNVSLSVPVKDGFRFDGWFYDNNFFSNAVNKSNITNIVKPEDCSGAYVNIYAKWIEDKKEDPSTTVCTYDEYSIRYDTTGGDPINSVKYSITQVSVNLPTPVREGYKFEGWYYDQGYSNIVNSVNIVNINKPEDCSGAYVNIYAKWSKDVTSQTGDDNSSESSLSSESSSSSLSSSSSSSACDYSSYNIYFNTNGGNKINYMSVRTNQNYVALPTPRKNGYVFAGWYYDRNLNNKVTITNATKLSNIVKSTDCSGAYVNLYARWIEEEKKCTYSGFDVIFNVNGGTELEKVFVQGENANDNISVPTKEGYEFGGWYYDSELTWKVETDTFKDLSNIVSPEDCSTQYVNLYAKWVTIIDSSDVSILLFEGMKDDIKSMKIEKKSDVSNYENYEELNDSNFVVYEIDLLDSNGEKIQPSRRVTVSINVPDNLDKNNLIIYLVDGERLVPYDVIVEEKDDVVKAYFDTDHFSTYILSENIVTVKGRNLRPIIMIFLASFLLVFTVFITIKFKKTH